MDKRRFLSDEERKSMPTKKQILDFWDSEEGVELLSKKTGIVRSYSNGCFVCGYPHGLEMCHIVAKAKGGSYSVKNLHLLCGNCHEESEDFNNGDERYWRWFRKKYIRDFKEPFQQLEDQLNLVDLSFKQIFKLCYLGKKDEAIKIIAAQHSPSLAKDIKEQIIEKIPEEGFGFNEEQAEEMANLQVSMMNQRIITEYSEDEWEGALSDRDTN